MNDKLENKKKPVTVSFDNEPLRLPDDHMTPNEILTVGGLDPATHYLVEKQGRHQIEYKGKGDDEIRVHDGDVFVSVSTGPTTTS